MSYVEALRGFFVLDNEPPSELPELVRQRLQHIGGGMLAVVDVLGAIHDRFWELDRESQTDVALYLLGKSDEALTVLASEKLPETINTLRLELAKRAIVAPETTPTVPVSVELRTSEEHPVLAGRLAATSHSRRPAPSRRSSTQLRIVRDKVLEDDAAPMTRADLEDDWRDQALCAQTDPEAFFPEKGGSTRDAKRICQGCEVQQECLNYALDNDERFGIWGGKSERERRALKRKQGTLSTSGNEKLQRLANLEPQANPIKRRNQFLMIIMGATADEADQFDGEHDPDGTSFARLVWQVLDTHYLEEDDEDEYTKEKHDRLRKYFQGVTKQKELHSAWDVLIKDIDDLEQRIVDAKEQYAIDNGNESYVQYMIDSWQPDLRSLASSHLEKKPAWMHEQREVV